MDETEHELQQRCLAGAIVADESGGLAGGEIK